MEVARSTVCRESGRFAGWPANYGMWAWREEVLVGFVVGWTGRPDGVHARDTSRPFVPMLGRSTDGGRSWRVEPFQGRTPGAMSLSADEHVDPTLRAAPKLSDADFAPPDQPIDFADPETIVLCARTGLAAGARSWFYVSADRGRSWCGPHPLPTFGLAGVAARTDVVPLADVGRALFLLTGTKQNGNEGRVFAARTTDGGRTFRWRGWVGPEPDGWAIMPSSIRTASGAVLCAVRCSGGGRHWIDGYRSEDEGATWLRLGTPVPDTGYGGNPPALTTLSDGRTLLVFGVRAEPFGLRYVVSGDDGASWSEPSRLTSDTGMHDMGYPRVVTFEDGSALACFYSNETPEGERFIEAIRWRP
jgi:BNR repeat-like domain